MALHQGSEGGSVLVVYKASEQLLVVLQAGLIIRRHLADVADDCVERLVWHAREPSRAVSSVIWCRK
jgi:hypothetical protein